MKKTTFLKPSDITETKWLLVDANNQVLGRIASKIAAILRGKHKVAFTPHVQCGDYVVVINADKIKLTGTKSKTKVFQWYTGWAGGQKEITYDKLLLENPTKILEKAVYRMLPGNKTRKSTMERLKIYAAESHPHTAQKPELIKL